MEIAEGRPRRANAGNLLRDLLECGLDEVEEELLRAHDEATSDSSFSVPSDLTSDDDELDSDFDAVEEEGTLRGEQVETEASARRDELRARRLERQKEQRRFGFTPAPAQTRKGGRGMKQKNRKTLRREPKSKTLHDSNRFTGERILDDRRKSNFSLAERLAAAHVRAKALREREEIELQEDPEDATRAGGNWQTRRQVRARRRRAEGTAAGAANGMCSSPMSASDYRMWLYAGPHPQRVAYHSSRAVLEGFGVPVVISFSEQLPPVFEQTAVENSNTKA